MKKTSCRKCLFAHPALQNEACEHGVVEHLLSTNHKKLSVVDEYYEIEDYQCRMGFSKETFETNKDSISIEDIKRSILNNAAIQIHLVLDITDINTETLTKHCQTISGGSILPKFISFCLFSHSKHNQEKIETIRKTLALDIPWKTHVFLEGTSYTEALHSIIGGNKNANGAKFVLIYNIDKSSELEQDINEINTICIIEQRDFHVMKKRGHDNTDFTGLLISYTNYFTARRAEENILNAINSTPEIISYEYGT
jgi:hypothetical protein